MGESGIALAIADARIMAAPEIATQKEYYDARWAAQEYANVVALQRAASIFEELARLRLEAPRIIDLGCGSGWFTAILNQFGPTTGVDQTVDIARQRHPGVAFMQGDIAAGSISVDPADVVVSQEVLEHLEDPQRFVTVAAELLRPAGYLVLTTPNARVTFGITSDEWRKRWLNQPVENHVTPGELTHLLASRFDVLRCRTIVPGVGRKGVFTLLHSRRCRLLWPLTLRLGFGLHIVAVARRR